VIPRPKLFALIGATVGGAAGWWLGARVAETTHVDMPLSP